MEGEITMPEEYFTVAYEQPSNFGFDELQKKYFKDQKSAEKYFNHLVGNITQEQPEEGAIVIVRDAEGEAVTSVDAFEYYEKQKG